MFAGLQIPVPDREIQQEIATEMRRRRGESRRLKVEAEAGWESAKEEFECELLGEQASS